MAAPRRPAARKCKGLLWEQLLPQEIDNSRSVGHAENSAILNLMLFVIQIFRK
jgi:hypothetical protein